MPRATVELDFFGMDQHHRDAPSSSSKSQFQKFLQRPKSFRDIHTAMSKINPEAFKSVIASGNASPSVPNPGKSFSVPSSPKAEQVPFSSLPLYVPTGTSVSSFTAAASESLQETKPLTIFYNGTVSVFDVPRDKVDNILKLAIEGNSGKALQRHRLPSIQNLLFIQASSIRPSSLWILLANIYRLLAISHCKGFLRNAKRG